MNDITGALQSQMMSVVSKILDEKSAQVVTVMAARWQDRLNRRIAEAEWAVKQSRIYDPDHALMKIYDAYRWVADNVTLEPNIVKSETGAQITMTVTANDGSAIDEYRQERIGEVMGDFMKQINYDYF